MAKQYPEIDNRLRTFIQAQQMFFVATAPSGDGGHVNLSPKGLESFRILAPREVAYLDYTGSGAETIAHLRQNGRITVMFCAFTGPPNIVRLHGSGCVVEPQDTDFAALVDGFRIGGHPIHPGLRSVIRIEVDRVSDSCGFGVPRFEYQEQRPQLTAWAAKKSDADLAEYRREKNSASLDGLPTLRWLESKKEPRA